MIAGHSRGAGSTPKVILILALWFIPWTFIGNSAGQCEDFPTELEWLDEEPECGEDAAECPSYLNLARHVAIYDECVGTDLQPGKFGDCLTDGDCPTQSYCCVSLCEGTTRCYDPFARRFQDSIKYYGSDTLYAPELQIMAPFALETDVTTSAMTSSPTKTISEAHSLSLATWSETQVYIATEANTTFGTSSPSKQSWKDADGTLKTPATTQTANEAASTTASIAKSSISFTPKITSKTPVTRVTEPDTTPMSTATTPVPPKEILSMAVATTKMTQEDASTTPDIISTESDSVSTSKATISTATKIPEVGRTSLAAALTGEATSPKTVTILTMPVASHINKTFLPPKLIKVVQLPPGYKVVPQSMKIYKIPQQSHKQPQPRKQMVLLPSQQIQKPSQQGFQVINQAQHPQKIHQVPQQALLPRKQYFQQPAPLQIAPVALPPQKQYIQQGAPQAPLYAQQQPLMPQTQYYIQQPPPQVPHNVPQQPMVNQLPPQAQNAEGPQQHQISQPELKKVGKDGRGIQPQRPALISQPIDADKQQPQASHPTKQMIVPMVKQLPPSAHGASVPQQPQINKPQRKIAVVNGRNIQAQRKVVIAQPINSGQSPQYRVVQQMPMPLSLQIINPRQQQHLGPEKGVVSNQQPIQYVPRSIAVRRPQQTLIQRNSSQPRLLLQNQSVKSYPTGKNVTFLQANPAYRKQRIPVQNSWLNTSKVLLRRVKPQTRWRFLNLTR